MDRKFVPEYSGVLRSHMLEVPACIREASGIKVFGRRIKSLVFSTDVAIIKNCNADAVIAVYPFTPQPSITQAVLAVADMPVFVGVGGGLTKGTRVVSLATDAEFLGAMGVVVNAPTENQVISAMKETLDIPIILTVVSGNEDIEQRMKAGVDIFNVSGAGNTAKIVSCIRQKFPEVPIIATGGPTEETITKTIEAGANAITYTPPTTGQLFSDIMNRYRAGLPRE